MILDLKESNAMFAWLNHYMGIPRISYEVTQNLLWDYREFIMRLLRIPRKINFLFISPIVSYNAKMNLKQMKNNNILFIYIYNIMLIQKGSLKAMVLNHGSSHYCLHWGMLPTSNHPLGLRLFPKIMYFF